MSMVGYVFVAMLMAVSVCLAIIILLQSKRSAGLGTVNGTSSNSDSYWSKNKNNSMEGSLERYTKILGALYIILALAIVFFGKAI